MMKLFGKLFSRQQSAEAAQGVARDLGSEKAPDVDSDSLSELPAGVLPDSVFFYTFHKCASSLFAGFVLKNVSHLKNVNYERLIAQGEIQAEESERVVFEDRGYIYGPIKLSSPPISPAARQVLSAATPDFVAQRKTVFLTRDPRDILVSQYLSFTGAHAESPVENVAQQQRETRERLSAMSLDEYVVQAAPGVVRDFMRMDELIQSSDQSVLTSYEEMVTDFDSFRAKLTRNMQVSDDVMKRIFNRSRPKDVEDMESHKRSGKVGGYADKLSPDSVAQINEQLGDVLVRFGYLD